MNELTLKEILDSLPTINSGRRYWFVRTNGGEYYDAFLSGNYVAVGYNEINLSDIKAGNTGDATGLEILSQRIGKVYGDREARPSYVATQLLKFSYSIRKGDVILIPSRNSYEIAFGEVLETPAYVTENVKEGDSLFLKRKKVKWLKVIARDKLDPNLYKLMYSHHTISEADQYAEQIDKITNSLFVKSDKAHMVLDVQTTKNIKAKDLFEMGLIALELLDEFAEAENLSYKSDEFEIKLNVQSPGFIELTGVSMGGIVLIGIILIAIAGGGFNFSYKEDVKASITSDGIIEKVRRFLTSKSNIKAKKELLEKHMKDLQIQNPEDLINVLKELDK